MLKILNLLTNEVAIKTYKEHPDYDDIKRYFNEEQLKIMLEKEMKDTVLALSKEAQKMGSLIDLPHLPASYMFVDVYKDVPPHLQKQIARVDKGE